MPSKFLRRLAGSDVSRISMVCFPHAGGGSSRFRSWSREFGGDMEVLAATLPGREGRLFESPMDDLDTIARHIFQELNPSSDRIVALAGISSGALLAYEVAHLLAGCGAPPRALFIASQRAPRSAGETSNWHTLEDDQLLKRLVEIGGLDARDAADPEFRSLFVAAIRADLRATETHRPFPRSRLPCPIFVYHGCHDPVVTHNDCKAWQEETSSMTTLRTLDTDHFLTGEARDLWLDALRADLNTVKDFSRSVK